MVKKNKNLVIVGSGPIGMVSALMFKEHFENVIILERQSKESFLQTHGFTFPIVFTPASIKILKRIGGLGGDQRREVGILWCGDPQTHSWEGIQIYLLGAGRVLSLEKPYRYEAVRTRS